MTIASTARKAGPLLGNGSATTFSFGFKVFATGDVKVAIANSAGVETVLEEGTHYTVSLNANQETSPGGTVTYPVSGSPLPTGSVLSIIGNLDYSQPLDLPSGGNFSPIALENQLDRATMQIQQLKEQVDRSAKLPVTYEETDLEAVTLGVVRLADSADNIDTVATSITAVNTVAADIADVSTVASNIGNVAATGANIAAVVVVANDLNEPVSEIETVAGSIANVNAVGSNIANVNTVAGVASDVPVVAGIAGDVAIVADNVADITNFSDVYYGPSAANPVLRKDGSALQPGDLYFYTGSKRLRVFDGTAWVDGPVNAGTITRDTFSGTGAQTAFTLSVDPVSENNTQVFIGGVYQQKSEYSVSGTTLAFSTAPVAGVDNIEVLSTTTTLAIGATTADLVGYDSGTAQDVLDEAKPMANYTALRAYTGRATGVRITQVGLAGFFQRDDADTTSADNGGTVIVDSAGRIWKRLFDGSVNVKWFGAKGDGVADDTVAIQAAVDTSIYNGTNSSSNGLKAVVFIPPGVYRITNTIHLGYGTGFTSVIVRGSGMRYRNESGFNGTGIIADFNDRPAFNFQGARSSQLSDLSIKGKLFDYVSTNDLGGLNGALNGIDDTVAGNWIDPTFPASASSRYAPYAAITIDAYSGARPAVSYPNVVYPAYFGAVTQYGKSFSSDVLIDNVGISGFVVGVANQPCDADGNGDFTVIRRVSMEKVQYGISVCNTQSRNVGIDQVKMAQYFCAITTRTHGRQSGKLNGTISNLSVGAGINIIDIGASYGGPVTFLHLYCEAQWRIGDILATSSNDTSFIFQSCGFKFSGQNDKRGVPANILGGAQQPIDVKFIGCSFVGFPSVINIQHEAVFDGSSVNPSARDTGALAHEYLALAHNALCGGVVFGSLATPPRQRIKFKVANANTIAIATPTICEDGYRSSSRTNCIPIYPWVVAASAEGFSDAIRTPRVRLSQGKSSLSSCSLTGKTLTFTFSSRTDSQFALFGPDNGDVICDDQTGMVFFVRSRTGTTVIAEAQNNYKSDGLGGYTTVTAFNSSSGTFYFVSSRLYTPQYYLRGDLTASSATLTNCARDDGFSAWYDAQISVDDYIWVAETQDRFIHPGSTRITARDQAAGTITLNGNVSRTEVRRRLSLFVRKPPANA